MRMHRVFGFVTLMLLVVVTPGVAAGLLDDKPRIAVMSAFPPEWQTLRDAVAGPKAHDVNGSTFVTGALEGHDVVLFLSGVSMVNAAMTTQQAIDRFSLRAIVFSGIAGGVDPALNIADVVVADRWAQYLDAAYARKTGNGYSPPPFLDTPFANYGMIHPRVIDVTRAGADEPVKKFWFEVDADLLETARAAAASVDLAACAAANECLSRVPRIVVGGSGVSGSAFVDNADFRTYVFDTFGAKVLDMESAATAHVAFNNRLPFIAFRSLSDLAGGGEGANEMGTFFRLASRNSAAVVRAFLRALPPQ